MKGSITIILGLVIMCFGILDILKSHFVSNSSLLCTSPHPMKYVVYAILVYLETPVIPTLFI